MFLGKGLQPTNNNKSRFSEDEYFFVKYFISIFSEPPIAFKGSTMKRQGGIVFKK